MTVVEFMGSPRRLLRQVVNCEGPSRYSRPQLWWSAVKSSVVEVECGCIHAPLTLAGVLRTCNARRLTVTPAAVEPSLDSRERLRWLVMVNP